uniref:Uncharacterized protein n=1 Tax=Ditylenchus dipsaci TaxID=166011 RepID=A0A915EKP8_9BILA
MDEPPKLILPDKLAPKGSAKTLINALTNSVRAWRGREKKQGGSAYTQLQQLNTVMKSFRESQNYHRRMLDIVVDGDKSYRKPTHLSERLSDILPSPDKVPALLRNLYSSLVEKLGNHTGSQLNYQFLPLKFAAIVENRAGSADQSTNNQALSPNLFPLYQPDQEDQRNVKNKDILPVSDLLDKAGIPNQNKGAMLELIMEASALLSCQALMDDIEGVTGLVATKFRNLKKKLNAKQNIELEKRKYTFMDKEQLHYMYSDRDLFPSLPPKLTDMFGNRSEYDHKQLLDTLIESLAHRPKRDTEKKDEKEVEEEKQQGGVFLSPFAFSPTIAQLTVLGPIILSPSIFSPAILGPAVLSPPILSPQVGNPLILSPYVLGPNILSAAVFTPMYCHLMYSVQIF